MRTRSLKLTQPTEFNFSLPPTIAPSSVLLSDHPDDVRAPVAERGEPGEGRVTRLAAEVLGAGEGTVRADDT